MPDQEHRNALQSAIDAFQESNFSECRQILELLEKNQTIDKDVLLNVYFLKGQLYYALDDLDAAIENFNQLLKLTPAHKGYYKLGKIYQDLGLYPKAIELLQQAVEIEPNNIEYLLSLAGNFRRNYQLKDAETIYRKVLVLDSTCATAYRRLVACNRYDSLECNDFKHIQTLLKKGNLTDKDKEDLCFAIAKIYDDCNDYKKAFVYFKAGNELRKQTRRFNIDKHADKIYELIETFSPSYIHDAPTSENQSTLPVFIIGLSRAGKTLAERLLNEHPLVADQKELAVLNKIVDNVLSDTQQEIYNDDGFIRQPIINQLTDEYLEHLTKNVNSGIKLISDTTPSNYRYIGYISLLFPKAKVVWCKRHPIDHCLQMYFKYYRKGHYFTYDMKVLADYYAMYLELMMHWQKVLPLEIMEVQYEDMIRNPKRIQEDLFTFLDLPSTGQAQSTIEFSHIELDRWQHFEKYLKPLKKRLKSYID